MGFCRAQSGLPPPVGYPATSKRSFAANVRPASGPLGAPWTCSGGPGTNGLVMERRRGRSRQRAAPLEGKSRESLGEPDGRGVTGGNGGQLPRVIGGTVATPSDVQVGPDEDEIPPVDLARGGVRHREDVQRRPGRAQRSLERGSIHGGAAEP